jgi:hypothetical protein
MKEVVMVALTVISASAALAETDNFDGYARGAAPEGWTCGVTGKGTPKWAVDAARRRPARRTCCDRARRERSRGA